MQSSHLTISIEQKKEFEHLNTFQNQAQALRRKADSSRYCFTETVGRSEAGRECASDLLAAPQVQEVSAAEYGGLLRWLGTRRLERVVD